MKKIKVIVKIKIVLSLIFVFCLPFILFSQTERWVYRFDGAANNFDQAYSVVYGADSNVYVAGYTYNNTSQYDFTVMSFLSAGTQRWQYFYNVVGDFYDQAYSLVYGADGNIYAAGKSTNATDFTIISLTPNGSQRWIYSYNGPGNSTDEALSVIYGDDGNIYTVGRSFGSSGNSDFIIISLTTTGTERWVYRYNGPGNGEDVGRSIVYGADGNIYAAGFSSGSATNYDFTVISLTNSGTENWVYRYNGTTNWNDEAYSIVYGADNNLYIAGSTNHFGMGISADFILISLTSSGSQRWVRVYNGPASYSDEAYCIIYGNDNNIYAAGYSYGSGTGQDLVVVSLTPSNTERWIYRYNGPNNGYEIAYALVYGLDGNIYIAGTASNTVTNFDFLVMSLTTGGTQRWIYQYNGPGNYIDEAHSLVYGLDNNIYAAGFSYATSTNQDFIVISLNAGTGIEQENTNRFLRNAFRLTANILQNQNLSYTISIPEPTTFKFSLFDIQGVKINSWQIQASGGTTHHTKTLPNLNQGIYYLRSETEKGYIENKKFIITK